MSEKNDLQFNGAHLGVAATIAFILLAGLTAVMLVGCPNYNVYSKHKLGEAELAQAEANRKILVQTAEAKQEAAVFEAKAEVARAEGIAQANKIIGDSLKDNPEYLRYLWIMGLRDGHNEVIYVATEAGVPITEAGRLGSDAHRAAMAREQLPVADELSGSHLHIGSQDASAVRE